MHCTLNSSLRGKTNDSLIRSIGFSFVLVWIFIVLLYHSMALMPMEFDSTDDHAEHSSMIKMEMKKFPLARRLIMLPRVGRDRSRKSFSQE